METRLAPFVAARYVFSRKEQRFISFVSLVSWLGLILGVAAMIVVMSVMNGFDREMRQRILRVIPHGFVSWEGDSSWQRVAEAVAARPGIEGVAPLIQGKAMVLFGGESVALELNGILPAAEDAVSDLEQSMMAGSLRDLPADGFGIVLGQQLARRLKVTVGDEVNVLLPEVPVSAAGVHPRQKKFRVVGVFRVGAEPDGKLAMTHINSAAKFFRQWSADKQPLVKQLRLRTSDIHRADAILRQLSRELSSQGWQVSSWEDQHRVLFKAIRMERRVVSLLLFAVIVVAVFNIASILVMMVAEKRHDIAILRVMGASAEQVRMIFLCQGLLIGILGVLIGVLAGSALALSLESLVQALEELLNGRLFSADVYYIAHLPSDYRPGDVLLIAGVALALCLLAAWYPARQAARIDPVHSLND